MNKQSVIDTDSSLGDAVTSVVDRASDVSKNAQKMGRKAGKKTRKSFRKHPKSWGAGALAGLAATGAVVASMIRRRTSKS